MKGNATLEGRIVAITGAARGIGEAAARAVADEGASVVLMDSDSEPLARVAASLGPRTALARTADVRSMTDLQAVAEDLNARGLGVDVLINNAAVYSQGPLLELPDAELGRCIEVNCLGMITVCKALVPLMRGRPGAHIMNVLSEFAWLPFPNKASYCISKAAAAMASACIRTELRSQGIRVTDFVPPAVDTGLIRSARALRPDLLTREVDVVQAHAWPADKVGRRIAHAIRRPRGISICGLVTRSAVVAARCFPILAGSLAAQAASRMKLS